MVEVVERLRAALAERYAIDRELGRGGMATVYLAEDLKHGRRVAIIFSGEQLVDQLYRLLVLLGFRHHADALQERDAA